MGTQAQGTYLAKAQCQLSDIAHQKARWFSRLYRAVNVIHSLNSAEKRITKRIEELEKERKAKKNSKVLAKNLAAVSGEFSDLVDTI